MTEWVESLTLGEAAAIAGLVTVVIAFLRKLIPAVRKASRLIDDVVGAPGHPGVMDRLAALERQVDQVADAAGSAAIQLHPNGGSSARDQIDALTTAVARIEQHLTEQDGRPRH